MVSKSALAIVAALGFVPVLWFSGYVIGASGQGEANSASPAQAADAPIEATKLGFLDLDAVLRADKRLKADLDRIKIALADAELSLEKDHGAALMDLERKVKNQRAGEPEWMKALQERTTKHIERIDEIAATKSDAVVERDRVLKQALDRIDAAVVKIKTDMGLDTVLRIRKPLADFSDSDVAKFRIKIQELISFDNTARDITDEVLKIVNAGVEDKKPEEGSGENKG